MAQLKENIGFIGSGNMGEAIIGAVLKADLFAPDQIVASDISIDRLAMMKKTYGIRTDTDNSEVFKSSDIIVLSIKPQKLTEVLEDLLSRIDDPLLSHKLIISIMAGIRIDRLESFLYAKLDDTGRKNMPIIRVMPNTPALVLSGMSGMSGNIHCTSDDRGKARMILGAMGKVLEFEEFQLDAVTAMSGSGPAYFFYFIQAMAQGGIQLGLDPEVAVQLTVETAKGAANLISEQGETPDELIRKVASPGGTTQAALDVFKSKNVKNSIIDGILAAAKRSVELSQS